MHGPYTQIVAIDLGKFNSVVCLFDPANGTHRFQSLATTPTSIHDLLASLIRTPADAASVPVVFETLTPAPSSASMTSRFAAARRTARSSSTTSPAV